MSIAVWQKSISSLRIDNYVFLLKLHYFVNLIADRQIGKKHGVLV